MTLPTELVYSILTEARLEEVVSFSQCSRQARSIAFMLLNTERYWAQYLAQEQRMSPLVKRATMRRLGGFLEANEGEYLILILLSSDEGLILTNLESYYRDTAELWLGIFTGMAS